MFERDVGELAEGLAFRCHGWSGGCARLLVRSSSGWLGDESLSAWGKRPRASGSSSMSSSATDEEPEPPKGLRRLGRCPGSARRSSTVPPAGHVGT